MPRNETLKHALHSLVVCLSTALTAAAQTIAVNDQTPPSAVTVEAAATVSIAISGGPANTTDWVGLYPVGAGDRAYLGWSYLSGTTTPPASGVSAATFSTYAPLSPGDYEWRLFANNGLGRIATSSVVTVTASRAVLSVNGVTAPAVASVGAGGSISVSLAGGPGNPTDWIGLAPAGTSDTTYLDWRYLNGTTVPPATGLGSGTVQFLAPVIAGSYELRLFAHNTNARLATATSNISASTAVITVDDTLPPTAVSVAAGAHVNIGVTGGPAQPSDWVGLYPVNAPDSGYRAWCYLNGSTAMPSNGQSAAQLTFAVPVTPGSYEFRFFNANTHSRLATSTTMVVATSSAVLSVNGVAAPATATAAPASQAVVSLAGGPANVGDWVGLYLIGAPTGAYVDWRYLNDTTQLPAAPLSTATLHFVLPITPATYEFRFSTADGGLLSTSGSLVVPQTLAQISVNGVAPPETVSAAPGNTLAVQITGGPANPTDWVALAAQGAPNSNYLAWDYLNGLKSPPSSGLASATLSFVLPSEAGTYELRLFASNGHQRITTSSAITASTEPAQVTVGMTSPFPGTTFNAPSSVPLAASASITGGTISRVDFYTGSTLIGSAPAPPYATSWVNPPQSVHVLRAAVVDSTNALTASAPITVTIAPPGSGVGTLASPMADPPGGIYGAAQTVTLKAAPDATIRYTVDGTDPDETSPPYSEALAVTQSRTLRARAYQPGWTASEVATAAYVIDTTAPTITAAVSPSANAAGWHNTTVTVSFTCADNVAVSTCPDPVTVTSEGTAQLVSAAAIDSAGNATPVSVSVSLDRTAPLVDIPAELPAEVASGALLFDAAVSDNLAGLSGATCNGVASQTIGNPVTCSLNLHKGRNVLVVAARDAAGNVGSDSAIVSWIPTAAASSIVVSPVQAGMIVGESRTFSVRDDQGRAQNATWETSDPAVVDFVDGRATAVAPGEATLTATASGLNATADVVVYAGPFLPAGAVRWSNPSTGGAADLADTIVLNASTVDGLSLVSIEFTNPDRRQPLVRGLTVDGTELWTATFPIGPDEWIERAVADSEGGVLAVALDISTFKPTGIVRAGWSDGVASWRRDLPDRFGALIFPAGDGTLYVSEYSAEFNEFQEGVPVMYTVRNDIVGMDVSTGAVRFRMTLPSFTTHQQRIGQSFQDVYELSALDGIALSSDNNLYLTTTAGFLNDMYPVTWSRDTKLMRVGPTGEAAVEQLWQGQKLTTDIVPFLVRVGNMQADGAGGVFFQTAGYDPATLAPGVIGRYRSSTFSNNFEMADDAVVFWAQVTGIDSTLITARDTYGQSRLVSFDMRSGVEHWALDTSEVATVALAGGGAVLVDGQGGYRTLTSSGATESEADLGVGAGEYAFGRFHPRDGDGTLKAVPWKPLNDATAAGGGGHLSSEQPSAVRRYGFHAKAYNVAVPQQPVFKHLGLALVPRNQEFWISPQSGWQAEFKQNPLYGDLWVVTTGGAPAGTPPTWKLWQYFNKADGDFVKPADPGYWLGVDPAAEDATIGGLLDKSRNFPDGLFDYDTVPTLLSEGYNSNSFMRGLLNAQQLTPPPFFTVIRFPGSQKPIPPQYFAPH